MASSTIFKNFNQPIENKAILLITKDIAEGKYKDLVEPIRMAIGMGKADRVDRLKKSYQLSHRLVYLKVVERWSI